MLKNAYKIKIFNKYYDAQFQVFEFQVLTDFLLPIFIQLVPMKKKSKSISKKKQSIYLF